MYNADVPPKSELPASRALLRSTAIAAAVALVLLVTVVLPAEYGIDPTRIGRVLGLTQMGEIKVALAKEAEAADAAEAAAAPAAAAPAPQAAAPAASAPASTPPAADSAASSHVTELSLAPGEGKEIKLAMREGARVNFEWTVAGGVVNFDTHADRPGHPVPRLRERPAPGVRQRRAGRRVRRHARMVLAQSRHRPRHADAADQRRLPGAEADGVRRRGSRMMRIENTGMVTGILAGFPARTPGAGAGGRQPEGHTPVHRRWQRT